MGLELFDYEVTQRSAARRTYLHVGATGNALNVNGRVSTNVSLSFGKASSGHCGGKK